MSTPSTTEVLERLEILWRKLEDEGLYVRANTVALAIEATRSRLRRRPSALSSTASAA